jgi:hypothetical protein
MTLKRELNGLNKHSKHAINSGKIKTLDFRETKVHGKTSCGAVFGQPSGKISCSM